jgi:ketosteroid isomerase-like protein
MKSKTAQTTLYFTLALLAWVPAYADEFADVGKLAKAGKVVEALNKANEYLGKHPADAQMRFMKGVLLTEQNKSDEAIAVFTKLTEDYKDLPEPYNNLAVLYAANGQYDKARVVLEKAIHTNPSYQTAYENLGDIYGKMASQAYDKALALGSTTPAPGKSKLTMLRTFSTSTGGKVAVAEPVLVASAQPPLISPLPPQDAARANAPQRLPALSVAPPPAAPKLAAATVTLPPPVLVAVKLAPTPAPAPTPALPPVKAEPPKPARPDTSERDAVMAQVHGWSKAWAAQNVDAYLGYYSQQFEPPKGLTRKAWADERRARIEGKGRIHVEVASPEVVVTGNTAKVSFRQTYESDRLTARSRKTLVLVKNGGKWQIKQEISGN